MSTARPTGGPTRVRPAANERGQVVPLMVGVIVLVALLAVGMARVGAQAVDRARAQNAADAAALAAALQFDPATAEQIAVSIARRNGATLADWRRDGVVTVVEVHLGSHDAIAAARPLASQSTSDP